MGKGVGGNPFLTLKDRVRMNEGSSEDEIANPRRQPGIDERQDRHRDQVIEIDVSDFKRRLDSEEFLN